jgi:acyl carrier protein
VEKELFSTSRRGSSLQRVENTQSGGAARMESRQEIRNFIVDNFLYGKDDNSLSDDMSFLEKGIIDSTGVLELVSFIEERYGLSVSDDELIPDNFDSLNKLETFVTQKMALVI